MNASQTTVDDDESAMHVRRIRAAASSVLGNGPVGRAVQQLCDDHAFARQQVLSDRSSGATVLALVGATGQGKSWVARQLVNDQEIISRIPSGNLQQDTTRDLIWIGPTPPADLDKRHELYLRCPSDRMHSLGGPYLLVDAPGATDDSATIASVALNALNLATVLLLVVRHDDLRSQSATVLGKLGDGAIVLPIVTAVRDPDADHLAGDIDALASRMRGVAINSQILRPIIVPDFAIEGRDEAAVGQAAVASIAQRLQSVLDDQWSGDQRKQIRLRALEERFTTALGSLLQDQLPRLTHAVQQLRSAAAKLPHDVAQSLIGDDNQMQTTIRWRLRLSLLSNTSMLCFPYRSLLGTLHLTNGAWDRLLMSLSGSLPSMVGTVWVSARNLMAGNTAQQDSQTALQKRAEAAATERLGPLMFQLRDSVERLRSSQRLAGEPTRAADQRATDRRGTINAESIMTVDVDQMGRLNPADLLGLDSLQQHSHKLMDQAITRGGAGRWFATLAGLLGTLIFWALLTAPIVQMYREYLGAAFDSVSAAGGKIDSYPHPSAAMVMTCIMLSALPTALYAIVVMWSVQRLGRVKQIQDELEQSHRDTIDRMTREGTLRLQWSDPLLEDAEYLLSAGLTSDTHSKR